MPTGDVHGLASGARVVPRPVPQSGRRVGPATPVAQRRPGLHLPMGDGLLGRVVDSPAARWDRGGPSRGAQRTDVRRPINAMDRDPVRQPLDTGVRAINAMLTVGRGQHRPVRRHRRRQSRCCWA